VVVGGEGGGQTAAILSSITRTCRRHGIDPQRYLTQLLTSSVFPILFHFIPSIGRRVRIVPRFAGSAPWIEFVNGRPLDKLGRGSGDRW
jgi:hypothetical protein